MAGAGNVVVRFDPAAPRPDLVEAWVRAVADRPHHSDGTGPGRLVEVPVVFDGPDLDTVAAAGGLTPDRVVELLTGAELRVAFLGFSPGFPYLVGLPAELETIGRRPTPRTSVPAGSVAVAGGYAAVYPQSTPGGWQLLGHTGFRLFDPDRPPYATLRVGDRVRFTRSSQPSGRGSGRRRPAVPSHSGRPPMGPGPPRSSSRGCSASSRTEGAGRSPPSASPRAGRPMPTPCGWPTGWPATPTVPPPIEITVLGPTLRFSDPVHLVVVGCRSGSVEVRVDGHPVPLATPCSPSTAGRWCTSAGSPPGCGPTSPCPVASPVPRWSAHAPTDLLSGLGPAPLVAGDRLELGAPVRPRGLLAAWPRWPRPGSPTTIAVLAGPHRFPPADLDRLTSVVWTVDGDSNRIGLRLRGGEGPAVRMAPDAEVDSTAMITGAVQVPPDGDPIILMPDHATVGGYPVIACVISADLAALGQLRPRRHPGIRSWSGCPRPVIATGRRNDSWPTG